MPFSEQHMDSNRPNVDRVSESLNIDFERSVDEYSLTAPSEQNEQQYEEHLFLSHAPTGK